LGGGSSDAATTLIALSHLWGLQMSESNLHNLATALGSDVPFFLTGGTVLSAGRGDELSPLPSLPEHWVVLMRPDIQIADKTQLMYANLSPREYTSGIVARHLAQSIREGQPLQPGLIFNAFEWIAFRHFDLVDRARQQVVDAGADYVRLCGSGPALYAIYAEEAPAHELFERLQEQDLEVYLARTIEARPEAGALLRNGAEHAEEAEL
jgi:4-diphosphocytidyl-2-C-methyl-D-erythritol kinase